MNMFELSAFGCPVVGIITGIYSTQGSVPWRVISGASIGMTTGLFFYSVAMAVDKHVYTITETNWKGYLTPLHLVVQYIAALLWMGVPFSAWPATVVLVKAFLAWAQ